MKLIKIMLLMSLIATTQPHADDSNLFTLQNLERERAALIELWLDADKEPRQRQAEYQAALSRLVNSERMVLRDTRLKNSGSARVRHALANYEMTFLAHAAAEQDLPPFAFWLTQLGLTPEAIDSARLRRLR